MSTIERLALIHGAEHRHEHNGTLEVVRFEPWQLAALIAEVRREERERCAQECDDLGQSDGVTCAKELRIGMPATHQYHCTNSSCSGPEWFGAAKQSQAGTHIDCPRCGHPADVEPTRARLDSPSGKEEGK